VANYTYYLGNVVDGTISAALPFKNVTYTSQLNTPGTFTGTLTLSDPGVLNMAPVAWTTPAKTALWIDRNGVLEWGGMIWGRSYDSTTYQLTVTGSTFDSYGLRRYIETDTIITGVDQLTVAASLWNTMQTEAHGNIHCPASTQTSGVLINAQWLKTDYKRVTDAIKDLTNSVTGFDYGITVAWTSMNTPSQQMIFGYPNLGRVTSTNQLLFQYPGNILSYTLAEDGASVANTSFAFGAGSGATQLYAYSNNPASLSNGYPVLQGGTSYKDITDFTQLLNFANADSALYNNPPQTVTAVVRGDLDPIVTTYGLGDYVMLQISDFRYPALPGLPYGISSAYQIRGLSTSVDDQGVEKVTMTLMVAPS
jgi:hypothetical protein